MSGSVSILLCIHNNMYYNIGEYYTVKISNLLDEGNNVRTRIFYYKSYNNTWIIIMNNIAPEMKRTNHFRDLLFTIFIYDFVRIIYRTRLHALWRTSEADSGNRNHLSFPFWNFWSIISVHESGTGSIQFGSYNVCSIRMFWNQ